MRFLVLFALLLRAGPAFAAPAMFVDDVETLVAVEAQGYSFADQMGSKGATDLAQLHAANAGYQLVADSLIRDLASLPLGRKDTGPSMRFSRRTLDGQWLKSRKARFELAGITYRPDRKFLHAGLCGEARLIYRLAYVDPGINTASRLPMTVQQVRTLRAPCAETYGKWGDDKTALLRFLEATDAYDLELNLQSVRWPAAIRPDMGGYAEYVMRAFEKRGDAWQAKRLTNTIDVAALQREPELKKELLAWLKEPSTVALVDRGEAVLPQKFLATKVSSVAVHGLNRKANQLFGRVYAEADFVGLDFAQALHVKSPKGYLRKLEELTCVGCHQSKSVAGFHFLGKDRPGAHAFNKVMVPFSYHFITDQERRRESGPLGFVDRPTYVKGARNERCYVGGDKTFAGWTCQTSACEPVGSSVGTDYFGVCQDKGLADAGDACYFGRTTASDDPHRDREIRPVEKECKGALGCLHPSDGYPGGLCFANFCDPKTDKACAALAVPGFNPCLARNRPFGECLERFTGSIEAAYCDVKTPCRDDFICAEGFAGKGVCAPPYSLFQLRVDGHGRP